MSSEGKGVLRCPLPHFVVATARPTTPWRRRSGRSSSPGRVSPAGLRAIGEISNRFGGGDGELSDDEIVARLADWTPPPPRHETGVLRSTQVRSRPRVRARSLAPDAPLRRDVRFFGDVLGRVLVGAGRSGAARRRRADPGALPARPRPRLESPAGRRGRRAACRAPGARCSARSRSTSSSPTSPSSTTGSAGGGSTRPRSGSRASRSPRRSRCSNGQESAGGGSRPRQRGSRSSSS